MSDGANPTIVLGVNSAPVKTGVDEAKAQIASLKSAITDLVTETSGAGQKVGANLSEGFKGQNASALLASVTQLGSEISLALSTSMTSGLSALATPLEAVDRGLAGLSQAVGKVAIGFDTLAASIEAGFSKTAVGVSATDKELYKTIQTLTATGASADGVVEKLVAMETVAVKTATKIAEVGVAGKVALEGNNALLIKNISNEELLAAAIDKVALAQRQASAVSQAKAASPEGLTEARVRAEIANGEVMKALWERNQAEMSQSSAARLRAEIANGDVMKDMWKKNQAEVEQASAARLKAEIANGDTMKFQWEKNQAEMVQASAARLRAEIANGDVMVAAFKKNEAEMTAASALARQQILKNHTYETSSLGSQASTVGKAASLVGATGNSALATEIYGSKAVGDIANYTAMQKKLEDQLVQTKTGAHSAAEGHWKLNEAMREGHSLARGLLGPLGQMWLTWGSLLPLLTGAAIATGIKGMVQNGKELEYQLTFVAALTDSATISTERFSAAMAGSQLTTKEGALGLRALAQAGLNADQALSVLPAVMNMAVVGELSLAAAALSATGIIHAFNLELTEIGHVTDVMTKAAAISNTSVEAMTNSMKTASVVADLYHVSLEETSAAMVILASRNIIGTSAGTALKNSMAEMAAPVGKAAERIKQLGLEFYDNEKNLKSFKDQLIELNSKTVGFTEQSRNQVLTDLFGERGVKAIAALLRELDKYGDTIDTLKNKSQNFAEGVVNTLNGTVQGQLKRTANELSLVFDEAFAKTGDAWSNLVTKLNQGVRSEAFKEFIDLVGTGTIQILKHSAGLAEIGVAAVALGVVYGLLSSLMAFNTATTLAAAAAAQGLATATTLAAEASTALSLVLSRIFWPVAIVTALGAAYFYLRDGIDAAKEAEDRRNNNWKAVHEATEARIKQVNTETAALNLMARENLSLADAQKKVADTAGAATKATLDSTLAKERATVASLKSDLSKAGPAQILGTENTNPERMKIATKLAEAQASMKLAEDALVRHRLAERDINLHYDAEINKASASGRVNTMKGVDELYKHLKDQAKNGTQGTAPILKDLDRIKKGINELAVDDPLGAAVLAEQFKSAKKDADGIAKTVSALKTPGRNDEIASAITLASTEEKIFLIKQKTRLLDYKTDLSVGNIGELQYLELLKDEAIVKEVMHQRTLAADLAIVQGVEKKRAAEAKFTLDMLESKQRVKEANQVMEDGKTVYMDSLRANNLRAESEAYKKQGDFLTAFLNEYEAKYSVTIKKIKAQIADPNTGINDKKTLQKSLKGYEFLEKEGTTDAVEKASAFKFDTAKAKFDNLANSISKGMKQITDQAKGLGLASEFEAAAEAEEKYRIGLVELTAAQNALKAAKASGTFDLKKAEKIEIDITNAQSEMDKLAAQTRQIWMDVGTSISTTLTGAFGAAGTAAGSMITSYIGYAQKQKSLDDEIAKNRKESSDPEKLAKLEEKYSKQSATLQVKSYGDMASAAKGFFEANSKGYKALEGIEKAFRVYEMAMTVETMAKKLFGLTAVTTATATAAGAQLAIGQTATSASIVQSGQTFTAAAPGAIAKAGAQTGWIGAIAMAAMMVALGFASSGGFNSGTEGANSAAEMQKKQGTGTILGDAEAKSNSISDSMKLLADNSDITLVHTQDMLRALQSIDAAMSGLAAVVFRSNGMASGNVPSIKQGLISYNNNNPLAFLGGIGETLGNLWGKNSQTITDSGFHAKGSIGQFSQGQGISQYANVENTSTSWFGLVKKTTQSQIEENLSPEMSRQFALVFTNLGQAIKAAGSALGLSGDDILDSLNKLEIDLPLSIKDLKGSALTDAINNWLSAISDTAAAKVLPGLEEFQKVGEGYFQTVVRVASGLEMAGNALEKFGIVPIKLKDILNKQGDVPTEILRQSIVGHETIAGTSSGIGQIINRSSAKGDDLAQLYSDLKGIQSAMSAFGTIAADVTVEMVKGAGSLEALKSGVSTYNDKFFTDSEKLTAHTSTMAGQFAAIGKEMPKSNAEFRKMVEAQERVTPAGQKLYGQLMSMAGGFADLTDESQKAADSLKSFLDNITQLVDGIHQKTTESIFNMGYGLADNAGKYDMLDKKGFKLDQEMRNTAKLPDGSVDLAKIAATGQKSIDLLNQAWALLSPEQQRAKQQEFEAKFKSIDDFITGQGADATNIAQAANDKTAKTIADAVAKAVKDAMDAANETERQRKASAENSKPQIAPAPPIQIQVTVTKPPSTEVNISEIPNVL